MKLIKTKDQYTIEKYKENFANNGCNICPCCGKTNIISMISRDNPTGFLGLGKTLKVDVYTCNKCGAEWESDAY
jgi:transcription elongation factor Elf1